MRGVGNTLYSIMVSVTCGIHIWLVAWIWYWFALSNAARSHKRRFFSPHSSYYSPNNAGARLHCTAQTELCTVYVMILNVPLLSPTDILVHSIFLQLFKSHMAFRKLQFLVSNCNAKTVSSHVFLHPEFLPPLLSGWNHKWYWLASIDRFKTAV